jgi:hypothetical protein
VNYFNPLFGHFEAGEPKLTKQQNKALALKALDAYGAELGAIGIYSLQSQSFVLLAWAFGA